jgi:hypothetical protein
MEGTDSGVESNRRTFDRFRHTPFVPYELIREFSILLYYLEFVLRVCQRLKLSCAKLPIRINTLYPFLCGLPFFASDKRNISAYLLEIQLNDTIHALLATR